ncbi:UNVERIFIED_CONTAM: hypothetical protein NY603_30805, partial [Bacteroidetes bacterium 56_B9]
LVRSRSVLSGQQTGARMVVMQAAVVLDISACDQDGKITSDQSRGRDRAVEEWAIISHRSAILEAA